MAARVAIILSVAVMAVCLVLPALSSAQGSKGMGGTLNCAECGMVVKPDGPFASRIDMPGEKTLWFCDLGDMMLHYDGLKGRDVAGIQVKDYTTNTWTDGRKAWYLTGSNVKTPMRYDIIAFDDKKAADEFKVRSGGKKVVSFDEAISLRVFTE